jgi:CubicO group peptidase (beta-lactamase class C family)
MTNQNPEGFVGVPGMGHGLSGTVNLESGEYSWGGAAKTSFWINPTHDLIVICYTQLFSKPSEYAQEFKAAVDRAIIDSDSN